MFWYRLGAIFLVAAIVGVYAYWEFKFFPERVATKLNAPATRTVTPVDYESLLAEPPPELPEGSDSKRAIAFKRAFEEPDGFQLTPPLLDNLISPSRLEAIDSLKQLPREDLFPVPPSIRPAVDFWKDIYSKHTSDHVAIHDKEYLNVVYDVLDFSGLRQQGVSEAEYYKIKKDRVLNRIAEIDSALKQLDKSLKLSRRLSAEEGRIWKLWSFLGSDEDRFKEARENLRSQTGLRNRFKSAIERSGSYLPYMEDIFINNGLPPELTRLVFVESMFTNKAISKTGAVGLWQFMPGTAKRFMKLNEWVDERLDPFIATDAAARLLKSNHEILESWPLSINAYNTGAGRMKQAIRRVGTDNIGVIIRNFKGSGYGFASRNFYPSFIAALEVADNYRQIFGDLMIYEPITYEVVHLPARARIDDIADILELDVASLRDLNPALLPALFEPEVFLPLGASIRVPLGDGANVIAGIYNLARQGGFSAVPGPDATNHD